MRERTRRVYSGEITTETADKGLRSLEGRRPPGRPKKTWRKVLEKDMRMLNVMEEMAMDRQQWRRLIAIPFNPSIGNKWSLNDDDDNDDDDLRTSNREHVTLRTSNFKNQ